MVPSYNLLLLILLKIYVFVFFIINQILAIVNYTGNKSLFFHKKNTGNNRYLSFPAICLLVVRFLFLFVFRRIIFKLIIKLVVIQQIVKRHIDGINRL